MSVLDRLAKVQAARPQGGQGGRMKGIFHQWKDGSNKLRLAGDFVEVRTHFIAPSPKRKDRGLCQAGAFQGDEKLPQVINCLNWDIALERPKKEKTCPICKLNAVARAVLTENPSDEEKKFFEALRQATRATSTLKWNILDRDDPFVVLQDNGKEEKVLGFKIASVGPEAANDIFGIFKQVGYDINDPDRGLDIEVIRDSKGARTTYSARLIIAGSPPAALVTPFTAEERKLELHDLKARCGKQVDSDKIVDALHEDLRDIISVNVQEGADDASVEAAVEDAVAEVSEPEPAPAPAPKPVVKTAAPAARPAAAPAQTAAPKTAAPQARPTAAPAAAPTAGKVPTSVLDRLAKKPTAAAPAPATAVGEAIGGDDDGILDGTDAKKK